MVKQQNVSLLARHAVSAARPPTHPAVTIRRHTRQRYRRQTTPTGDADRRRWQTKTDTSMQNNHWLIRRASKNYNSCCGNDLVRIL